MDAKYIAACYRRALVILCLFTNNLGCNINFQ